MAIFHLQARIVSRSRNNNAVKKAAYNNRSKLTDEKTGHAVNYERKGRAEFSGLFVPANSPEWAFDRQQLWNEVEKKEKRKDSQLAREIIVAFPEELDAVQRKRIITDFAREQFMRKGMVADVNIHVPGKEGDARNHHAHILLTMRSIGREGFGKKVREWNRIDRLEEWRKAWEGLLNRYLIRVAPGVTVSRLSLKDQDITTRAPKPRKTVKDIAVDRARVKPAQEAFKEQGQKLTKRRFTPHVLKSRKPVNQNMPQPVRPVTLKPRKGRGKKPET